MLNAVPAILDADLLRRRLAEPAPFLALLHDIQDRLGWLPESALIQVADALGLPLADVFSAATFYHYFRLRPPEASEAPSCDGPACALRAGVADGVSCPGRCDLAPACLGTFDSPLPPESDAPEFLFRHLRERRPGLADYRSRGGYRAPSDPDAALARLAASGLSGRGGAGFPAAAKWRAVRNAAGTPKAVVCNADEGEPGCFKDRVLLDHDPHAILDGMLWAGRTVGASFGLIYLRYEYPQSLPILERAIAEARDAGLLDGFPVHVRRGAGAYVCGEETALLNSLEGRRPFPRERPPYPTERGLFGKPTLVHNVETLAAIPWILGRDLDVPTRIFSVSGDVVRPGNYELDAKTTIPELLRRARGVRDGRRLKAVSRAGLSGGFVGGPDLDGAVGAAGTLVYDDTRCMVRAAAVAMRFFARESCGKCFPCRIGTTRLLEYLEAPGPADDAERICRVMSTASACGLGLMAPSIPRSLAKYWPEEVDAHRRGACLAGECGR